jgi:hypothetical protein
LDDLDLSEGIFFDRKILSFSCNKCFVDDKIVSYVNGGCLPRITCVPVYAQQVTTGGIVFPNCVEVHRCSGCCQEAQFSCEPTKIEYVSFSPVKNFYYSSNFIFKQTYLDH